eukprot:3894959-Prymnesium_polylepis.1
MRSSLHLLGELRLDETLEAERAQVDAAARVEVRQHLPAARGRATLSNSSMVGGVGTAPWHGAVRGTAGRAWRLRLACPCAGTQAQPVGRHGGAARCGTVRRGVMRRGAAQHGAMRRAPA